MVLIKNPCERCRGAGRLFVVDRNGTDLLFDVEKTWNLDNGFGEVVANVECYRCGGTGREGEAEE